MMRGCAVELEGVSFGYPAVSEGGKTVPVLDRVDLSIEEGAFCILAGDTGSGKTTLLRLMKPELRPHGACTGRIGLFGQEPEEMDPATSAGLVGYVFQNPENQIVCDTVWHELAFGLENLGIPQAEMHQRVAETCYFFGIEPWYRKRTAELSGGQKQILALASLLCMRPRLLLLDEPASMLDPLAARTLVGLLYRMNKELGIAVVVATHDPEPFLPYADSACLLEEGEQGSTVRKIALEELAARSRAADDLGLSPKGAAGARPALAFESVWQRWSADAPWVLKDLAFEAAEGSVTALVGGNGSGKSTALAAAAGFTKTQHGKVRNACARSQAYLPQSPKALFSKETIAEELMEWGDSAGYGLREARACLAELGLPEDDAFLARHPYDLSGGQQQLLAAAKVLLVEPRLLLLDEPTKGLDAPSRRALARALRRAQDRGATILLATHDEALIRALADAVVLVFDGGAAAAADAADFLARSWLWGRQG